MVKGWKSISGVCCVENGGKKEGQSKGYWLFHEWKNALFGGQKDKNGSILHGSSLKSPWHGERGYSSTHMDTGKECLQLRNWRKMVCQWLPSQMGYFESYESIFEAVVSNISIQTSEFIKLALKDYVITCQ